MLNNIIIINIIIIVIINNNNNNISFIDPLGETDPHLTQPIHS